MICEFKRVKLRRIKVEDIEAMDKWGIHEDPLFYDYNFPIMTSREKKSWYKIKTAWFKECFVILDEFETIIGYISLRKINPIMKTAEMGIVLDPKKIAKKYGREAIMCLLSYFFATMKYDKLFLSVAAFNVRGFKCYKAIGFEKISEYYGIFTNEYIDPLKNEEYRNIHKYFKRVGNRLQVLYYRMEISTLPTGLM